MRDILGFVHIYVLFFHFPFPFCNWIKKKKAKIKNHKVLICDLTVFSHILRNGDAPKEVNGLSFKRGYLGSKSALLEVLIRALSLLLFLCHAYRILWFLY